MKNFIFISAILSLIIILSSCQTASLEEKTSITEIEVSVTESQPEATASELQEPDDEDIQETGLHKPFAFFNYRLTDKLPQEMIDHIKTQRETIFCWTSDAGKELFKSYLHEEGMTREEDERIAAIVEELLARNGEDEELPESLTHDEAAGEITFIFDYMKYAYGGYGYFGGDAVFLPLRDEIFGELDALTADGSIGAEDYISLLEEHLYPLIIDAHFRIGIEWMPEGHARQTIAKLYYAVSEEYVFHRLNNEYVTILDGEEYTLISVDGGDPEEYVKATLLEDGSFAYVLGESLSDAGKYESKAVDLQLKGKNAEKHVTAPLKLCDTPYGEPQSPAYRQYEQDGVPVIVNTVLYPADLPELKDMVDEAKSFRNRKAIIINVLNNNGGMSDIVYNWASAFLGSNVSWLMNNAYMATKTADIQRRAYNVSYADANEPFKVWYSPNFGTPMQKANNTAIFLLMSYGNGSAGEAWPQFMSQTDNVVMVGTNTMGCLQFGSVMSFKLPNSRIYFQCGTQLSTGQDMAQFECVATSPTCGLTLQRRWSAYRGASNCTA